ncbi:MAG: hypothetical protein JWO92_1858 [Chitinophagaceae bacterium]|nr:hypothetical protein [Chitinophagaceae bacterium]MDB5223955.1 hypothetical protein [Chitinophagaceae bacterium]
MKKLLFSLMAFTFATAVFAQKKAADVAKLSTDTYDFGKIKQSVPATATFIVTNIGTEPLIIEQANPTCGCTISDYTKAPIAPGKTGYIKATYNAVALGGIHKTLTVKFAGVDEIKQINLAGEVLEPAAYDTWAATNKKTDEITTVKVKDDKVKTETKTDAGTSKVKTKKGKKVVEKSVVKK